MLERDVTKETLATYGIGTGGWNGDVVTLSFSDKAWIVRGGTKGFGASSGVMTFSCGTGGTVIILASRSVVTRF